ncbi:MAG: FHA domain-containing protein [Acidobacteria bacterium]|nr:FHA domain-containing protein [Acidobacteriota bacterium]
MRKQIFNRVESSLVEVKNGTVFPFTKINIRLRPRTKSMAREFKAAFTENASLKSGLLRMLKETRVYFHPELEISVELDEETGPRDGEFESSPLYEMEFAGPVDSSRYEIPEIVLEVVRGSAERTAYRLSKERLLVGCLPRVKDREGRLVRINNIVFPGDADEINATVSDMHARIWFDFRRREFCVMDESSLYGTRISREGHTIEVPADNPRGVGLRSGDVIYFGQAGLRFRMEKSSIMR